MGISGRIARFFVGSQLTPLVALVAALLGVFAVLVTPREEEPQINVTMANVLIPFPGASAKDVESLVATPAEQVLGQITGVEHIFSVSKPGLAVLTVQFKVGENRTDALVRLYDTVMSNRDWVSPNLGTGEPIIKPMGIDDVPIVTLTLWTADPERGAYELERVAHAAEVEIKRVPGTRTVQTVGGPSRSVRVLLDAERMQAYRDHRAGHPPGADRGERLDAGRRARRRQPRDAGRGRHVPRLRARRRAARRRQLPEPAGVRGGRRARRRRAGAREALRLARGEGRRRHRRRASAVQEYPAVTIAVAKKPGENAVDVAARVIERVEALKGSVIPEGVNVAVTRNYGETANDKAQKLIQKLIFATLSVVALVWLALGRREAVIVGVAVLLTLAATLFASWAWGFTLNRVSLFALIFSIGILVDDAIVVVENIHRHRALAPDAPLRQPDPARGRRGGRADDPRDLHRDRRAAADGVRDRPDGAVHEPDPDQRLDRDADLARGRVRRHAVARGAAPRPAPRRRGRPRGRREPAHPRLLRAGHDPVPPRARRRRATAGSSPPRSAR